MYTAVARCSFHGEVSVRGDTNSGVRCCLLDVLGFMVLSLALFWVMYCLLLSVKRLAV